MAVDPVNADPSSRKLIEKWARLHAVRTILGFAATLIFVCAALRWLYDIICSGTGEGGGGVSGVQMPFKKRIQSVPNCFLVIARNLVQKPHSDERVTLGRQDLNSEKNDILAFSPSWQRNTLAACQRGGFGGHSIALHVCHGSMAL
jgi:hypothetical protein